MRRRELVAGIGSAAVVGGAGLVAVGATPRVFGGPDAEQIEPMTIETIDAPGSRDGEVTVADADRIRKEAKNIDLDLSTE